MAADRRASVGAYSRFVSVTKIALPLLAVVLMSTIFLVGPEEDFESGIVFSAADIEGLSDGLKISNPRFAGVTQAGDTVSITADSALPDGPDPETVAFDRLTATTEYVNGDVVTLTAKSGVVTVATQVLYGENGVEIETSRAYRGTTDAATADLVAGTLETVGSVSITGPIGQIDAGRMSVRPSDNALPTSDGPRYFWFENGVKVVYLPPDRKASDP